MSNTETAKKDPWKIMKEVVIPRLSNTKEQPDLVVSVNCKTYQMQRGKTVKVPLPVYEVIMHSSKASEKAEDNYYSAAEIKEV